jgi:hypothetical protein
MMTCSNIIIGRRLIEGKVIKRNRIKKNLLLTRKSICQNKKIKIIAKYNKSTCRDLMEVQLKYPEVKVEADIET